MARASANFRDLLWDVAGMSGLQPDPAIDGGGLTEQQTSEVLLDLNEGYELAYTWQGIHWEDAWKSGTLTPVAGVISYAQIEDSALFTLWTADPRVKNSGAVPVDCMTSDAGLHLQADVSTVYAFWKPVCPRFSATAYDNVTAYAVGTSVMATDGQVYRALVSTTGNEPSASPTQWRLQPVVQALRKPALLLAMANRATRLGNHGEARKHTESAEAKLEDQAALEFPRVSGWWWIRRKN